MKRTTQLFLVLMLSAAPAWSGDATLEHLPRADVFRFDLDSGLATLREWMTMADRLVKEHVDLRGEFQSGRSEEERSGRLQFKFYPKGRSQSHEAVEAETMFKSQDGRFSFQFQFREPEVTILLPEDVL